MAVNRGPAATSKAVLFDKDGTLIRDVPYNVDPSLIELAPGAAAALVALQAAGYRIGIVTNQSGVARGYFDEASVALLGLALRETFERAGVEIECFLFCPHHPDGAVEDYGIECDCRKPKPGLVRRALATLDADPAESWFVGDILNDVEAGSRAGCRTVMLDVGNESEWRRGPYRTPDVVAPDLLAAARAILEARLMTA
jgi:histidinol-phosphate phosphatase family protein